MKVLVLRPEPGASETAARARAAGLDPFVAPLFSITGVAAEAVTPDAYDAILLTSANGARFAPPGLGAIPCYAVGEATAAAARAAGFAVVCSGPSDGAAAVALMARNGVQGALHLCGRDHLTLSHPDIRLDRLVVYASEALPAPPLAGPAVALVHSPRAGARLAQLAQDKGTILIAAISDAAACAAGEGWRLKAVAKAPRDAALLELAAALCKYASETAREAQDGV